MDVYRSYVINYNLGQDLVREYIEARADTAAKPPIAVGLFLALLQSPRLPSELDDRLALPSRDDDLRCGSRGRCRAARAAGLEA
jgi:hypothetical protein